jgi:hypothetical protein
VPAKPRFDDGLRVIIDDLDKQYPIGLCSIHPTKQCFHHRGSDTHYELDRQKKIVWAAQIVSCLCIIF